MSDYKTLLVHYDAGRTAGARLETAIQVAGMFDAHVICLYALGIYPMPSAAHEAGQLLIDAQKRAQAEMLAAARAGYEACVQRTGYKKIEWREMKSDALSAVPQQALGADLLVIGQKNEDWTSGVAKDFEQRALLAVGRPVLVVPYAYERKPIGRRILIAWNASREAARAVGDAMPLLERAEQVQISMFRPDGRQGDQPGADLAANLKRHGVKATISRHDGADIDVGNLLLSTAFDAQADLIVMGAWSHTRLAELVLGGVTRTILGSMTVPVLMSH
jgi:nucleotide-binding universal stress UspA family protein